MNWPTELGGSAPPAAECLGSAQRKCLGSVKEVAPLHSSPAPLVNHSTHRYVAAAFASLVAFVFALLGIIHQPEIKFVDGAFMDGYQTVLGGDGCLDSLPFLAPCVSFFRYGYGRQQLVAV